MNKDQIIFLSTEVVLCFQNFNREEWLALEKTFGKYAVVKKINGCGYIHCLMFFTSTERDLALQKLHSFAEKQDLSFRFFFRGEDVNSEMIAELEESRGDFAVWEKYFL